MKYRILLVAIVLFNFCIGQYESISFGNEINAAGGGYPRMAEFSNGNLLLGVDTGNGIEIHLSTNQGDNWNYLSTAVPSNGLPTNYHVGNVFLLRISDQEWLCAYRYINDHDAFTPSNEDDGINDYSLHVTKSVDGGQTWNYLSEIVHTGSSIPNASANPGGVWEPFMLFVPQTEEVLVFYAKEDARPGPGDTQKIICKRSYDYGATWSNEIIVAEGLNSRDGMPEVIITPNNQLICVFEAQDNVNNNAFGIKIKRSDDFGFTWHSRTSVHNSSFSGGYGAGAPYIVQLNDGRLLVSYQEQNGSSNPMKFGYVVSENDGQTWSNGQYLFSGDGWWNSMFVNQAGTLFMNTSGVKILKANFSTMPDFYFKIEALHSSKIIATSTAIAPPEDDEIEQQVYSGMDNQLWKVNDAGNGYFYLSPKNDGTKAIQVFNSSLDNGAKIVLKSITLNDFQLWFVTESPNGYYQIINKGTGKVLDVKAKSLLDGASIIQWGNKVSHNQKFKAIAVNGGVYDPLKPFIKWKYSKLVNKNSGKVADVAGFDYNLGANVQQWDFITGINQQWRVHDADSGYVWFEPKNAIGKCLEINAWGLNNGSNIALWTYLGNDNQKWKPVEVEPGYVKLINKYSGLVLDVANASLLNGENIHAWQWLNLDNQKWGVQPIIGNENPLLPFLNYGQYSCQIASSPGTIGGNQILNCVNEDPSILNELSSATGETPMSYQWQYSQDNVNWLDVANETGTTYDPPVLQGLLTPPFVIYARRKHNDACETDYSNIVTVEVLETELLPGSIDGNQIICESTSPEQINSITPATSNSSIAYQWEYSLDNVSWQEVINETSPSYTPQNIQNIATPPFTYYARRKSSDNCEEKYSNVVSIEVESCLGLNKIDGFNGLSIYPNPTNDVFTISSTDLIKEIVIIDLNGEIVKVFSENHLKKEIDVSSFKKGIYFVKVITMMSSYSVKLVVK